MKACVLKNNKDIEYTDICAPKLQNGEVLVKIAACGICSSDFNRVYNNGAYFYPLVLGHEFSGIIEKCADDIDNKYLGKKVAVFPLLPCFECESCQKGMYAQCKKYNYFGSRCNGAMAEYIAVPLWNVVELPSDIDYKIGALCEPCAVAIHAVNKIKNLKSLCISGSGTIGILCGLIAKSRGINVSFILRNSKKLDLLRTFGFKNFILKEEECLFDTMIECVGTNQSIQNCIKYVKQKGTVILVGNPVGNIEIDKILYWKILRSELSIEGVWNSEYKNKNNDDWQQAVEFLHKNSELVSKLITKSFKLSDGIKAFDYIRTTEEPFLKGVFVNEE